MTQRRKRGRRIYSSFFLYSIFIYRFSAYLLKNEETIFTYAAYCALKAREYQGNEGVRRRHRQVEKRRLLDINKWWEHTAGISVHKVFLSLYTHIHLYACGDDNGIPNIVTHIATGARSKNNTIIIIMLCGS